MNARFTIRAGLILTIAASCLVGGCTGSAGNRSDTLSTIHTQVVRGLVVPSGNHGNLAGNILDGDPAHWSLARNDQHVNPRPAEQPWAIQWVHTELNERLRIHNGRPLEHTTIRRRTYQLSPSR